VTDAGGSREHMVDAVTGVVCRDEASFEMAAMLLLRNPKIRRNRAVSARAYALTCQWSKALEPVYAAYADLCLSSKSGTRVEAHPALIR
jgi:hypothetical protein